VSEQNIPPILDSGFVAYPRGSEEPIFGSSEKLTKLYRGYHGMSYSFLFVFLSVICLIATSALFTQKGYDVFAIVSMLVGIAAFVAAIIFGVRSGIDIGYGVGWTQAAGAILGFLAPFVGVLMIAIIQYIAIGEIKRYGIPIGSFSGIKGKLVRAKIKELAAIETSSRPNSPSLIESQ
jgi:hypothetical protein